MHIDPESYDSPNQNPLRRFTIVNVGSVERLLREISADVPIFMNIDDGEECPPLFCIFISREVRATPEKLKWERLTLATPNLDEVKAVKFCG